MLLSSSLSKLWEILKDLSGNIVLQSSGLKTILHQEQFMLSTERYSHKQNKKKVHSNTKCHYNDNVRPPCKLITFQKWLHSPSTQASECSLKSLAFLKSVVLKLQYSNQPVSHFYRYPYRQSFYIQIIFKLQNILSQDHMATVLHSMRRLFVCKHWLQLAQKSPQEGQWLRVHKATPKSILKF